MSKRKKFLLLLRMQQESQADSDDLDLESAYVTCILRTHAAPALRMVVQSVACAEKHACVLLADGRVYQVRVAGELKRVMFRKLHHVDENRLVSAAANQRAVAVQNLYCGRNHFVAVLALPTWNTYTWGCTYLLCIRVCVSVGKLTVD